MVEIEENQVIEIRNWRLRIKSEMASAKNWKKNWGFLITDNKTQSEHKKALVASQKSIPRSAIAVNLKDRESPSSKIDYVETYIKQNSNQRLKHH